MFSEINRLKSCTLIYLQIPLNTRLEKEAFPRTEYINQYRVIFLVFFYKFILYNNDLVNLKYMRCFQLLIE